MAERGIVFCIQLPNMGQLSPNGKRQSEFFGWHGRQHCLACSTLCLGKFQQCFPGVQGYFHGNDWSMRLGTPFCLVPSGSGNALAANCGLWTPQASSAFPTSRRPDGCEMRVLTVGCQNNIWSQVLLTVI